MALTPLRKLIIGVFIILLFIGSFISFIVLEGALVWTRGYGLISCPYPPYVPAMTTLYHIDDYFLASWRHYYNEEKPEGLDYRWPDAKTIAANIPEVSFTENQPYTKFGIYILKSRHTEQLFLYSPIDVLTDSNLTRMKDKLRETSGIHAFPVIMCVMAAGEGQSGEYVAYPAYPLRFKELFGAEEWKKWYFIVREHFESFVQSDIPPIPGCLARTSEENRKLGKFYYPEEIILAFKAIYPNADIPEEQILREGRDY